MLQEQLFTQWDTIFQGAQLAGQKNKLSTLCANTLNLGFSLRVLYCVVDAGYGLGRSLGNCRPALPKGQKYQMVKTQTESHDRRPIV